MVLNYVHEVAQKLCVCVCVECNTKKQHGRPVDATEKEDYGVSSGKPLGTWNETTMHLPFVPCTPYRDTYMLDLSL